MIARHACAVGLLVGAALLAAPTKPAAAQDVSYSGSLGVSSGEYIFTERTTSWVLLNALGLRTRGVRLGVTLPVILQNSSAISYLPGGAAPTGGPAHGVIGRRRPGERVGMHAHRHVVPVDSVAAPGAYAMAVGDPLLRGSVDVYRGTGSARAVEVALHAKPPLASIESGVGTEAWDVGAGASLILSIARLYVFLDATYWHLGDMPDLVLHDNVSYGAAVGMPIGAGRWTVLGSISGASRIVDEVDPPLAAGLLIGFSSRRQRSFSLGVSAGLSEGSADLAVTAGWSIGISRSPSD